MSNTTSLFDADFLTSAGLTLTGTTTMSATEREGFREGLRAFSDHLNTIDGNLDAATLRVLNGNAPEEFKAGYLHAVSTLITAYTEGPTR